MINEMKLNVSQSRGYENHELPVKTISSREVAEMMEVKEHKSMLRKIDKLNEILIGTNLCPLEFWFESTYKDSKSREKREYQVTKKGCELIAHKTEGEKGVIFTVRYMERFEQMEKYIKQQLDSYMIADPIERAKRWIEEQNLANQQIEQLEVVNTALNQQIGELKPKADYTDMVLQSKSLMTVTAIAKDYGMTGGALNKKLHELGIQYKQGGQWFLYAKYQTKGYTSSSTTTIERKDGSTEIKLHTKWTQKGRLFIYDELKKIGIVPLIEQDLAS